MRPKQFESIRNNATPYTQFDLFMASDSGSPYLYASNFCYDRRKEVYSFYFQNKEENVIRKLNGNCKQPVDRNRDIALAYPDPPPLVFRYGWDIQFKKGSIPAADEATWVDADVYMTQPFKNKHITHHAESLSVLLLKLQHPRDYPHVSGRRDARSHTRPSTRSYHLDRPPMNGTHPSPRARRSLTWCCPSSARTASTSGRTRT